MALSAHAPRRVNAMKRRLEALELRRAGHTYDQIAKQLGVGKTRAQTLVKQAFEKLRQDHHSVAAELLELSKDRLDMLLAGVWEKAKKGQKEALEAALKIIDRQARLLGIDAPTQSKVHLSQSVAYEQMTEEELLAEARKQGLKVD